MSFLFFRARPSWQVPHQLSGIYSHSMVVSGSPKRWAWWHSPSPNWQYIPLIYHLYIAFWGVICYLPPFRGTRNNHWYSRYSHRNILVLVIGGKDFITPLKAMYTWYILPICYLPPCTRTWNIGWYSHWKIEIHNPIFYLAEHCFIEFLNISQQTHKVGPKNHLVSRGP